MVLEKYAVLPFHPFDNKNKQVSNDFGNCRQHCRPPIVHYRCTLSEPLSVRHAESAMEAVDKL
jgi:hypothetical protein